MAWYIVALLYILGIAPMAVDLADENRPAWHAVLWPLIGALILFVFAREIVTRLLRGLRG